MPTERKPKRRRGMSGTGKRIKERESVTFTQQQQQQDDDEEDEEEEEEEEGTSEEDPPLPPPSQQPRARRGWRGVNGGLEPPQHQAVKTQGETYACHPPLPVVGNV